MDNIATTMFKPRISVRAQTVATVLAVAGAVVLPKIIHAAGAAAGLGVIPGEVILPMHLPVILAGLLAGPYTGAVAGLLSPLVSFMISGMPIASVVPLMMIELCAYGFFAGAMSNVRIPSVFKVIIAQVAGRAFYLLAVFIAVHAFGNTMFSVGAAFAGFSKGIIGIAAQLVIIPSVVYAVEKAEKRNGKL